MANNEVRYREAEQRLWDSVGVTPIEQRVHLGRTGVSVRVLEVGEGPTVVFVHGATNGGSSWASLAARLDGFRRVLLDRPGCGLSDPLPAGFEDIDQLDAFADTMIVELLDGLGLETAHVVATARRFVEQLPSAQLELMPGVGHAPWMDDPDHAATVVRRFLDE